MLRAADLRMMNTRADEASAKIAQAQREENCARGLPSVKKEGIREGRVVIVGYGPSLADTWMSITAGEPFDAVWTVSKAHDFLIERGLVPTHHTDTHWDKGKAMYNISYRPTVKYMMATQVHPLYLDVLDGMDVRLFHVMYPGGTFDCRYYKSPATFDAGLQAAQLAYELGYRNQEWFGMDASARPGMTHAGSHDGWKPDQIEAEVAGKVYVTNELLLKQALFCELMLHERPKMRVKIHGDGALKPFLLERGRCSVK